MSFEEQVARLEKGEFDEMDVPTPGENAQVEGADAPPVVEEAAPVESAPVEEGEQAPPEDEAPAKGIQARINQLTRQKHEAKREAEYWRKAAMGDAPASAPPQATPQQSQIPQYQKPKPRLDDFANDQDPYASLAYAAGEWAAEKRDYENNVRAFQAQQAQQASGVRQLIATKMEQGVAKYPDFMVVTDDLGRIISPAMHDALFDSAQFEDVAYHLAQHLDEAKRIARLTPLAQIREIGKLEDKLAVKTANPQAKEVRTPTKVESAGSGIPKMPPNTKKMFEAAQKGGSLRDWQKYLEATEP